MAHLFSGNKRNPEVTVTSMKKFILLVGTSSALLMLEPDLGTTSIVAAIAIAILFFSGFKIKILGLIGSLGLALLFLASYTSGYRRKRLLGVLDPWQDPTGTGWQALQLSLIHI